MRHRVLVDMELKSVIAGQDRAHHRWTTTSVEHLEYMQQILDETDRDFFNDSGSDGFAHVDALPSWAAETWPWSQADDTAK